MDRIIYIFTYYDLLNDINFFFLNKSDKITIFLTAAREVGLKTPFFILFSEMLIGKTETGNNVAKSKPSARHVTLISVITKSKKYFFRFSFFFLEKIKKKKKRKHVRSKRPRCKRSSPFCSANFAKRTDEKNRRVQTRKISNYGI